MVDGGGGGGDEEQEFELFVTRNVETYLLPSFEFRSCCNITLIDDDLNESTNET